MLTTAVQIARQAGELALSLRGQVACSDKTDGTWVTEADRALEELIRHRLSEAFPGHAVYGEEFGGAGRLNDGPCWLLDPIDGTVNYVTGLPSWGVSIGLLWDGVPEVGVFYLPVSGELFEAQRGRGAKVNGCAVRVDGRGVPDRHSLWAMNSDALQRVELQVPGMLRNLGSTAAHGCYVASAGVVAAVFDQWRTWDVAAAFCIASEAGAEARYLDGRPFAGLGDLAPDHIGDALAVGPGWAVEALLSGARVRCEP